MRNNIVKRIKISDEEAPKYLSQRLMNAKMDRARFENEWQSSEFGQYDVGEEGGALKDSSNYNRTSTDGDVEAKQEAIDNYLAINLINRNIQLLHSQLCSNPPVVTAIPRSNEEEDKDSAIAAEYLMTYYREQYAFKDAVARCTLKAFLYGTGFIKNIFDGTLGRILNYNPDTDEYEMEGDNKYSVPRIHDMFIDNNANAWEDVRFIFERIWQPLDEAIQKFGEEKREILEQAAIENTDGLVGASAEESDSLIFNNKSKVVMYYEYWETGLPCNGFKGRYCYCLDNGYLLTSMMDSPCKFKQDAKSETSHWKARLPYSCITYLDVENTIWGRSPIAHTGRAQDMLNAIAAVIISTAQNMGIPLIMVPKGSVSEETISDYPGLITEIDPTTGQAPWKMQSADTSGDMKFLFAEMKEIINDGWGVNDAMFGKQQRETSGTAMQLSTIQGNLIRQRLFDKYTLMTKDVYDLQLLYSRDYWKIEKILEVSGKNSKLEVKAFKGSDLIGGYSLYSEFGQQFALDPITRQEQVMTQLPVFQAAGVDPRFLLRQFRLSEFRSLYDEFDQADDRAKEIISRIRATETQVPITSKYQDHIGIMAYMSRYTNSVEYKTCSDKAKQLIEQHLDQRRDMIAKTAMTGGGTPEEGMEGGGQPPM